MRAIVLNPSSIQLPGGLRACEFKEQIKISNLLSEHKGRWNSKTNSYTFSERNAEEVICEIGDKLESLFEADKETVFDNWQNKEEKLSDVIEENKKADKIVTNYMENHKEICDLLVKALKYDNDIQDAKNWILNPFPDDGNIIQAIHLLHPESKVGFCCPEPVITDQFMESYEGGSVGDLSDKLGSDFFEIKTRKMGGKEGQSIPERNFIIMDSFASCPANDTIECIKHAYAMLAPGGRLICTISENKFELIENWLEEDTEYYRVYRGASLPLINSNVFVLLLEA